MVAGQGRAGGPIPGTETLMSWGQLASVALDTCTLVDEGRKRGNSLKD
jgi:hypothetical protein